MCSVQIKNNFDQEMKIISSNITNFIFIFVILTILREDTLSILQPHIRALFYETEIETRCHQHKNLYYYTRQQVLSDAAVNSNTYNWHQRNLLFL